MSPSCRTLVRGLAAAIATASLVATPAPVDPADLPPELAAWLATQSTWSASVMGRAGYGYRDNLLLSATEREESPLVRASAEILLLRLGRDRFEYSFFAQGERTRFLEGRTVDHEAKAWVLTEGAVKLSDTFKFSLPLSAYYYDQVFDVSITEVRRDIAELTVRGLMLGPAWRWTPRASFWLETQVGTEWKRYDDRFNDSDVHEAALRTGWEIADRQELRLAVLARRRDFQERSQYTAAGRELSDARLEVEESEVELSHAWRPDRAERWRLVSRVGYLEYRDNGSGYLDHDQYRIGADVEWEHAGWTLRLGGTAERVEFALQTVGIGVDLPARISEDYLVDLHLERSLTRRWSAYATFLWERQRSNEAVASYRVNEGLLGLRWSWER